MTRLRRLRRSRQIRESLAETVVRPEQLIVPHFVIEGDKRREHIATMPGIDRVSVDELLDDVERDLDLSLRTVLLFGIPATRDAEGLQAADDDGITPRAIRALRARFGNELTIVSDVCLCSHTTHGHCGVLDEAGKVKNDATLHRLAGAALAHAAAGVDWIAPSDMMDHRVAYLRSALNDQGHDDVAILAYSAKFASAYYGPFRDAAHSAPQHGDRKTYQLDPRNRREALRELAADELEGADALMVKPALAYLDILREARDATRLPLVAYNVSGEYAMVKAAATAGIVSEPDVVRENLLAMRRAGADLIISYHARAAIKNEWLP